MAENIFQAAKRWQDLEILQKHYTEFTDFMYDSIKDLLGYTCTKQQIDIGGYLQYGPDRCMIQAQRGQAKTSIAGSYAVWRLLHNPTCRIIILSASDTVAVEIANWIIQIIMNTPELECLRPDPSSRDRMSSHAFDVHHSLKGTDKSPSIACVGIKGQLQARRADLLIADDVESFSNSGTEVQRELISAITLDFTSICSQGKIVYLGTPQSVDSTYNSLQDRGYQVRIWPGRFPTEKEESHYGDCLAPYIRARMEANQSLRTGGGPTGDRGQPTDPELFDDDNLTKKEIDQGPSFFQLQYMLDTRMMDSTRYPLHLNRLVFTPIQDRMPIQLDFSPATGHLVQWPMGHILRGQPVYYASGASKEFNTFAGTYMYVDPSGGGKNGDELSWAVTKFMAGYVYLVDIGGIPGGVHKENLDVLTEVAVKFKPQRIGVEKNFGNGALVQIWKPLLLTAHRCTVEEPWESGQKELRIIDILEPLIGSNRLVIDDKLIGIDWARCQQYPMNTRGLYSLFYQIAKITTLKSALVHDDRVDALAGACRPWTNLLAQDSKKVLDRSRSARAKEMQMNPLCLPSYTESGSRGSVSRISDINFYSLKHGR